MHAGVIKRHCMVCASIWEIWEIIHLLKLVDYFLVQTHDHTITYTCITCVYHYDVASGSEIAP